MPEPGIMDPGDAQQPADLLQQALLRSQKKVVLVLDLVESVRLMASDEEGTVKRWLAFSNFVQAQAVPSHHGRVVKSLGDGLMVEFDEARHAVAAANQLHSVLEKNNASLPHDQQMHLRAGINSSHVYSDALDIYGNGVNLTARLASLAGPGETIVSASVRDELTDGLDADVEDLGECYVKHVELPLRAYRVGPSGASPVVAPSRDLGMALRPTIAVIPFDARNREPEHFAVGELIADGVIGQLSRSGELNIISRLSSSKLRHRDMPLTDVSARLGANYVLSGGYVVADGKVLINAELAQANNHHIVWTHRLAGDLQDLLQTQSELSHNLAEAVHKAVLDTEVKQAQTRPLPTLQSYSLLLSGVNLMHRSTTRDFDLSRQVLELLVERHRNSALTRAWLAMWYVLKTTRGLTTDPARDTAEALDHTQRAQDADPDNAFAKAVEGFVYCHLKKDVDAAWQRVSSALEADPSSSLGWLYMGTIESLRGSTTQAVSCAERAMELSPIDPLRYYYLCLAGGAAITDGQWDRAATLLQESWRLNRSHAPTLRALVIANSELGRDDVAKQYLSILRSVDPELTVERYLSHSPGGVRFRERYAQAMARVGLPLR